jgi:tetratricopeptide (TPR) repeat protein
MDPRSPDDLLARAGGGAGRPSPAGRSAASPRSRRDAMVAEARRMIAAGGDLRAAYRVIEPLLRGKRPDAEALYLAGFMAETAGDARSAGGYAERSAALAPHEETHMLLARCRRILGETDGAVAMCDRVLASNPRSLQAVCIRAGALEQAGRIDEAEDTLRPLVEAARDRGADPPPAAWWEWAKVLVQRKRLDEAVAEIDALLAADGGIIASLENRRALLYLKAKAEDRRGNYAAAFEAARASNDLADIEYTPGVYESQLEELRTNWSPERIARFPASACQSEVPVFVAGMPRSGTSLIDQIIDAHPRAAGVGELATIEVFAARLSAAWDPTRPAPECFGPEFQARAWTRAAEDYVREITALAPPGAERVVNKSLGNNRLVGLLARLFPRTRIIHAIRDPRDVAVSCFMGGFTQSAFAWTHRVEHIAHAWEQSRRIMDFWRETLGVPILDVHYERLVSDPDREFPRIIEFLGLEWDDACTEFHKSRRTIRTLSYDQVNRPLYTSSVARHRNYAPWLEGVAFPDYGP